MKAEETPTLALLEGSPKHDHLGYVSNAIKDMQHGCAWPGSADWESGCGAIKLKCRLSAQSPGSETTQGGWVSESRHQPELKHLHCYFFVLQPKPESADPSSETQHGGVFFKLKHRHARD